MKFIPVFAISMILILGTTQSAFAGALEDEAGPNCITILGQGFTFPPISASPTGEGWGQGACIENPGGDTTWIIGDPSQRQDVSYVPGAGPWFKPLLLPGGFITQGFSDTLEEYLIVGGNTEWHDWHEVILPNQPFVFVSATISINGGPSIPMPISQDGKKVWIDFNPPLPPGTTVDIVKVISYTGINTYNDPILVAQYPTITAVGGSGIPIDTTALLLASAQSLSLWMIPVVAAGIGIGAFVIKRRN